MGQRSIFSLITCSLLALSSANLLAAPDKQEEQARWYDVELIIFSQTDASYQQDELWTDNVDPSSMEGVMELRPHGLPQDGMIDSAIAKQDMSPEAQAFRTLPRKLLRLTTEYQRLVKSKTYETLVHIGWRQPGLAIQDAIAVHIHKDLIKHPDDEVEAKFETAVSPKGESIKKVPSYSMDRRGEVVSESLPVEEEPTELSMLDGTIKLILARYLHLDVDLGYRFETEAEIVTSIEPDISAWLNLNPNKDNLTDIFTDTGTETNFEAMEPIPDTNTRKMKYQVFRLQQKRRMRSKELHHLDHPMFGLIALVTPYEFPVVEEEPPAIKWLRVD